MSLENNEDRYYIELMYSKLHPKLRKTLSIKKLFPIQKKAIPYLEDNVNLIVCSPTGSGKTLVAELIAVNKILTKGIKVVYIVPLRALANEKYNYFKSKYDFINIAITSGDYDNNDYFLKDMNLIIATAEKFDSLLRHKPSWMNNVGLVIMDEIHLLNDPNRGPTIEMILTQMLIMNVQIVGLSATIGNAQELSSWLRANLIEDDWRPVKLKRGIYRKDKKEIIFKVEE